MWLSIGQAGAGLVLLYFGGDALIRGASSLASRLGVPPLLVGLTVVAFGTSAPELVVSLQAALSGAHDIAVGNVVGSNIANVGLILGFSACLRPMIVEARIVRVDAPIMLVVSILLTILLANGTASQLEGAALLLGLLLYLAHVLRDARRETSAVRDELASAAPGRSALGWSFVLVLGGLALLVVGGRLLVTSAIELALQWGVSEAAIGLTIVAIGTSLPELTTSVIAAARKQGDIAIGNVVGSNIFNVLGILGITAVVQPLSMGAIRWWDLGAMIGIGALATVFLITRLRLERIEGAVLLLCFLAYMASLFWPLG